jgi:hypothetical protein
VALSFERDNDLLARKVGGTDLVRRVGHDLLAGEDTGLYELANLVMAHTKLCGRIPHRQPLPVLLGGAVAMNATNAAYRPDTVRRPGLALAGRHAHSVQ